MILVTGGTGLLGSHLLFDLTNENDQIRATYRYDNTRLEVFELFKYYDSSSAERRWQKIEWVKADLREIPMLSECFSDVKYVYHCAGLVSFDRKDFDRCLKINKEGTANVVNLCLKNKIKKLCHVSSTAAVGQAQKNKTTEKDIWSLENKPSAYSISKFSAEMEVWRGIEEGLNAVIINPCLIFGPGKWEETSLTIFKNSEKGMPFYTSGSNAVVDARDVSLCMRELMNSSIHSERFLCVGENISFKNLQTKIADALNKKPPRYFAPKWVSFVACYIGLFICRIIRKNPSLTPDTINSAYKKLSYDNAKIKAHIEIEFHSLEETIQNAIKGRIQSQRK